MPKHNATKLGKFLTKNIMYLHDVGEYEKIVANTRELVIELGYDSEIGQKVGVLVKKIYQNYDLAQNEYLKKNFKKESSYYSNAKKFAQQLDSHLHAYYDSRALVDTVINWRHGKKLNALKVIFKDYYIKTNKNILKAALCTYYELLGAFSHDKRNSKNFEKNFIKIWKILDSTGKEKLPILF